jgi:hypothetical protein
LTDQIDTVHACSHWRGDRVGPIAVLDAVAKRDIPTPAKNRTLVVQRLAYSCVLKHVHYFQTNAYRNEGCDQSVRPRGLRHELSSLARSLGSWVRIPLEAGMSVCIYSVFVLGSGLANGLSLIQGVLPNVLD